MRQKTNMNGLVIHVKPSGASYQSGRNKCERQLHKLQKLIDENYKVTHVEKKSDNTTEFKLFGTFTMEIPIEILIKAGLRK